MIDFIFIDMDGVLADLVGPICELIGFDFEQYPKGVYGLDGAFGIPLAELWEKIHAKGSDFWADLPRMDGARGLVAACQAISQRVYVLSGPSESPESYHGKRRWMERHFPDVPLMLIPASHKYTLAGRRRLLIDDSDANVDDWRKADGWAITYPQRWNRLHYLNDPLGHVFRKLDEASKQGQVSPL